MERLTAWASGQVIPHKLFRPEQYAGGDANRLVCRNIDGQQKLTALGTPLSRLRREGDRPLDGHNQVRFLEFCRKGMNMKSAKRNLVIAAIGVSVLSTAIRARADAVTDCNASMQPTVVSSNAVVQARC